MTLKHYIVPTSCVEHRILLIRGQRVIMDADLAELYGVSTKRLNEQVKRNIERFPEDFMFELSKTEKDELVAICDRFKNLKHSTSLPRVFTEHGAIMLANVLKNQKAVQMSIQVVRAFVRLRQILALNKDLAHKLVELERKLQTHDGAIQSIFDAIRQMMIPPETKRRKIGFDVG